jgi:hypothetical protein
MLGFGAAALLASLAAASPAKADLVGFLRFLFTISTPAFDLVTSLAATAQPCQPTCARLAVLETHGSLAPDLCSSSGLLLAAGAQQN